MPDTWRVKPGHVAPRIVDAAWPDQRTKDALAKLREAIAEAGPHNFSDGGFSYLKDRIDNVRADMNDIGDKLVGALQAATEEIGRPDTRLRTIEGGISQLRRD